MLPWDQLGDPPDCTCAQVIHSRAEAFSNKWVPTIATRAYIREVAGHDNVAMGKDLGIGIPRKPDLQLEDHGKKASSTVTETEKDEFPDLGSENDGGKLEKEKLEVNSETLTKELRKETADLIGAMTHCTNRQMETAAVTVPNDNIKDMAICSTKEIPSLELSLKRQRDGGEIGTSAQERNVLRHSDLSAFSRYNTSSTSYQAPAGNVGSCSPFDNSSEAAKIQPRLNFLSNSNESPNQHSNGSSNNNDMGSTTNNAFTKPESSSEKPNPQSVNTHNHSAFQPVQNGHLSSLPSVGPRKTDSSAVNMGSAQARAKHPHVQVQHHHHHYHHHHIRNPQQQQKLPNLDVSSLRAPHCEPSHSSSIPIEGNAANYSLNGSASGSNNGSNGENSRSIAAITEGAKIPTTNNELSENCGGGGGGSGSGLDQNRYTQREAALNKFRQKRKERCFGKKVRYHSRKRLAEQRPRVRGQFVRQAWHEDKSNEDKDC